MQFVCASAVVMADARLTARRIAAGVSMLTSIVIDPSDTESIWARSAGAREHTTAQIQSWTRPLTRVPSIDALLDAPRDRPTMRAAAVDLAEGILHQSGVDDLDQFALPENWTWRH
ncbi:hypothetical protein ACFWFR_08420 [Oerskovia sp. NPDC060287]|uniref:hypothetical protein n=1 Tax=Oerskovia sp. NPDC060287 TaxID=3347095 RepID=UPI00365A8AAF